jgi:enoyl-CoA hydratase
MTKSGVVSPEVRVERAGPITTVILARPEARNAVDRATAQALADAFRTFEADDGASVAVLWGEGGAFCAGADLKAIAAGAPNRLEAPAPPPASTTEPANDGPMGPSRMLLSKPVIAAIAGHAVAGGLELALFCDLRVAEEGSVLGVLCRRFGVPLIDGGTVRLPRIVGLGRALDLILTGRAVDAREALAMGLVDRVVPAGEARAAAEALARSLAALPQTCMREDRLSAYESLDLPFREALANEWRRGMRSLASDAVAGAQRFVDGRIGRGSGT